MAKFFLFPCSHGFHPRKNAGKKTFMTSYLTMLTRDAQSILSPCPIKHGRVQRL